MCWLVRINHAERDGRTSMVVITRSLRRVLKRTASVKMIVKFVLEEGASMPTSVNLLDRLDRFHNPDLVSKELDLDIEDAEKMVQPDLAQVQLALVNNYAILLIKEPRELILGFENNTDFWVYTRKSGLQLVSNLPSYVAHVF